MQERCIIGSMRISPMVARPLHTVSSKPDSEASLEVSDLLALQASSSLLIGQVIMLIALCRCKHANSLGLV